MAEYRYEGVCIGGSFAGRTLSGETHHVRVLVTGLSIGPSDDFRNSEPSSLEDYLWEEIYFPPTAGMKAPAGVWRYSKISPAEMWAELLAGYARGARR